MSNTSTFAPELDEQAPKEAPASAEAPKGVSESAQFVRNRVTERFSNIRDFMRDAASEIHNTLVDLKNAATDEQIMAIEMEVRVASAAITSMMIKQVLGVAEIVHKMENPDQPMPKPKSSGNIITADPRLTAKREASKIDNATPGLTTTGG